MRELKFRCWFPKTERMTKPFILGQLIEQIENTREEENGVYLQFTGLTDKNGIEIYEGDIVAYLGKGEEVVEFDNGSFMVGLDGELPALLSSQIKCGCEIIGNIYENKDLLKK